jgi:UDP-N-acetylglucosamine:LPS N-acetylglucosamine transferase
VGRAARAAAGAYPGTALPRAGGTGVPVRDALVEAARPDAEARRAARQVLGLPADGFVVAVVGGSLGARRLNEAVLGLVQLWAARRDLAVYHVVGRRDEAWVSADPRSRPGGELHYVWVPYEQHMASLYQAADVVVCRAGANTVAELTVVGVPAVLVPLPGAPADHQVANARVLLDAGAARVVSDPECTPRRLAEELDTLRADPAQLSFMRAAAAALGRPGAAAAVARLAMAEARPSAGAKESCRAR